MTTKKRDLVTEYGLAIQAYLMAPEFDEALHKAAEAAEQRLRKVVDKHNG